MDCDYDQFKTFRRDQQGTRKCNFFYWSCYWCKFQSPAAFVRLLTQTQFLQTDYTLGQNVTDNPYHLPIIRSQLTQALPLLVPEVHDEVVTACNEFIPITEGSLITRPFLLKDLDNIWTEWQSIRAVDTVMKVVGRASNRVFVGLPLCMSLLSLEYYYYVLSFSGRNPDFMALNVQLAIDILQTSFILRIFPGFLKP